MIKKAKNTKRSRIDWNKLKIKFMKGNYKSIREFGRKEGFGYSGNFLKNTKGWASEKAAKRQQIGCKIIENFMEEEIIKELEVSEKIKQISNLALDATEEFFTNKDYRKHVFEENKYERDEHDNYILNKRGEMVKVNTIDIVETSFVKIDKVRQAIETVNKVTRTLKNLGINLYKENTVPVS